MLVLGVAGSYELRAPSGSCKLLKRLIFALWHLWMRSSNSSSVGQQISLCIAVVRAQERASLARAAKEAPVLFHPLANWLVQQGLVTMSISKADLARSDSKPPSRRPHCPNG
jgi:hypothetical protein